LEVLAQNFAFSEEHFLTGKQFFVNTKFRNQEETAFFFTLFLVLVLSLLLLLLIQMIMVSLLCYV